MNKTELRKYYRERRQAIRLKTRPSKISEVLHKLEHFLYFDHYLLYAAMDEEFPTRKIFEFLRAKEKYVYFPSVDENRLQFVQVEDWDELKKAKWTLEPTVSKSKLWSPSLESLAFVPGIVFERKGHRIGFGKGFYDRFLSQQPKVFRLGLCFGEQIHPFEWKVSPTDVQMDAVLCPEAIWGSPSHYQLRLQKCF